MQRRDFALGLLAAAALPTLPAFAQGAWPQRPVKWILSQPAGSGPDILARYIADQLAKTWGQAIVIDNRPGGQNVIGAQAAARSAPDGYTFYYATTAAMITNVHTFKSLPYDPQKDFVSVRLVGRSPFVIAAGANAPVKDLADAIAQSKAQPGKLAIATEGPKTFSGMLADSVAAMADVKLTHVPYTKATDALQDVIGGRVPLVCLPEAALMAHLKSGQLRGLAVSTAQRLPALPQVPALSETFAGFEYTGWNGLFAPAGTPADVVARVARDLDALMKQPEVEQRLAQLGSIAETGATPGGFDSFLRNERVRWAGIVKAIGITAE